MNKYVKPRDHIVIPVELFECILFVAKNCVSTKNAGMKTILDFCELIETNKDQYVIDGILSKLAELNLEQLKSIKEAVDFRIKNF